MAIGFLFGPFSAVAPFILERDSVFSMGVAQGPSRRTEVPSISFFFGYISFMFLHTLIYAHARARTQPNIPDEQ